MELHAGKLYIKQAIILTKTYQVSFVVLQYQFANISVMEKFGVMDSSLAVLWLIGLVDGQSDKTNSNDLSVLRLS